MSKHHVTTTINGEPVEFLCETQQTLLDVAARRAGPDRQQGRLRLRRLRRLHRHLRRPDRVLLPDAGVEAEGTSITTIEGIAQGDHLHPVQQKFLEHAALQCGFCTPGFIVAAKALLDHNPNPTRDRGALLAGRQSLPLHRLRQDHPRRDGYRRRNARKDRHAMK